MDKGKAEVVIFLVGVFAGAYITHTSVKTIKKEVAIEKVQDHSKIKENKIIVEKIKPDGTVVRKIVQNTDTKVDVKKDSEQRKVEIVDRSKDWYAGAMVSTSFSTLTPVYGAQVHRKILGPFSGGIFVLTNGSIGATLGMSF